MSDKPQPPNHPALFTLQAAVEHLARKHFPGKPLPVVREASEPDGNAELEAAIARAILGDDEDGER